MVHPSPLCGWVIVRIKSKLSLYMFNGPVHVAEKHFFQDFNKKNERLKTSRKFRRHVSSELHALHQEILNMHTGLFSSDKCLFSLQKDINQMKIVQKRKHFSKIEILKKVFQNILKASFLMKYIGKKLKNGKEYIFIRSFQTVRKKSGKKCFESG